jgi:hypothetical protein
MSSLEGRLDSTAQSWRPQVGDKLVGTITSIGTRASQFGDEPYPVVTVRTDSGEEYRVFAYHSVLKAELAEQRPQVGDRIGISYLGKPEGRKWEAYKVVLQRQAPQQELDWNTVAADVQVKEADDIPF